MGKKKGASHVQAAETPPARGAAEEERHAPHTGESFPIVGVGASAGGLEAFTQMLEGLPADTGMGFVFVQHLDPDHESALTQILSRVTSLPVSEITNGERVLPDHIYVIPPNAGLSISKGILKLEPRKSTRLPQRPIDSFFESLAQDRRERAIGVVLSGTANDGTLGLEAIKAEAGITFAQDDSAKYDGMPRSAVAAGCVDFILSPVEIAKELARIAQHPLVVGQPSPRLMEDDGSGSLTAEPEASREGAEPRKGQVVPKDDGYKKILLLLRNHSRVDFSLYKPTTILRRITRRMVLNQQSTLEEYAGFLRGNANELDALYSDVLINVTSFFRNPESFDVLQHKVLPELLKQRGDGPLRCWVLGCSTGQEAYSIAIAFVEAAEKAPHARELQIFATDLNNTHLDKARLGLYGKSLTEDITPERLRRFFVEEGGGYRVSRTLREMVVFARQNLVADPPFSRMDLVSCRNLLIYLEPSLQKKAIPTFHYSLKAGGFLVLGASESVGGFTDLFEQVDKKHKIFSRKPGMTPAFQLPLQKERDEKPSSQTAPLPITQAGDVELPDGARGELNAQREADRITVNQFAPPAVLVNEELQVLQFRGSTGAFLEPPTGKATFDVLKLARKGLMLPLHSAINQAKKDNQTARRENVRVNRNGKTSAVNLEVIPLKNLPERCFLVVFDEARKTGRAPPSTKPVKSREEKALSTAKQGSSRVAELETEVSATREYFQSMQEQHETAHEQLQASSEELQSANEELQSLNEELETSKEELESANEELTTVNDEMSNRNVELDRLNNDLTNLQTSTKLAILLLGRDLAIRRFSPQAEKVLALKVTDVGRPIGHIRHSLILGDAKESHLDLDVLAAEVISQMREQELEVRENKGDQWYSLRLRPYLTLDNKVDGAVLVLVDITDRKRAEEAPARLASIVDSSDDAIISKDLRGVIKTWNPGAQRLFGYTTEEAVGKPVTLLMPAGRVDEETGILERVGRGETVDHYETVRQRKDGSLLDISLTVSPIRDATGRVIGAARIASDITDRKRSEALLDSQRHALQLLAESAPLDDVLGFLVGVVERRAPAGMHASIVPLNAAGTHFQRGIGAGLPDAFNAAIEGVEVSSSSGLCANAIRRREAVAVDDFNQDQVWQPFAKLVAPWGLRSGWSVPIVAANGKIVGSFANYSRRVGDPTPQDREMVEVVLRTAAIAIERKQAEEALQQSYADLRAHTQMVSRFNRVAVGREIRMMDLKKEVNDLSEHQGDGSRYALEFAHQAEVTEVDEPAPGAAELNLAKESTRAALNLMEDAVEARKAMETISTEAKESEDRLRFTLDATQVGQWDLDLLTDTSHRSPRHDQIFGYDELVPQWGYQTFLNKHVHPDDRAQVDQTFEQALANRKPLAIECRIIRTDHAVRWIWIKGIIHLTPQGKPVRVSGLVMDITERKRLETNLRQYGADLVDADQRKNEFLAMLGHELRNPLSALVYGLQLLGKVPDDRARSEELRGMMGRQTTRIVTLLDQLLDIARVISGKVELSKDRVELADVVRAGIETVKPLLENRKNKFTFSAPTKVSTLVMGDAVRLAQVVENLLTNAAKYSNEGGPIELTLETSGDLARMIFRDTGMGISAEFLPHVFEVFSQAPRALDRAQGGLGLGLPLVRRLVEMHGGQVEARSPGLGKGSEFVVTLPRLAERRSDKRTEGDGSTAAPAEPTQIRPRRILVVDDENDVAESLALILEADGNQTLAVNDGPAALAAVHTFDPEVVLLDLGLPEMNGYEVARRLRDEHADKKMLLIAVTGYQSDAARLKEAGFDQHLIKPPNLKTLSAMLSAWNGGARETR